MVKPGVDAHLPSRGFWAAEKLSCRTEGPNTFRAVRLSSYLRLPPYRSTQELVRTAGQHIHHT